MNKDQDLGETIELGVATIETLGSPLQGAEINGQQTHGPMGIVDHD